MPRGAGPLEPGRRRIEVREAGELVYADVVEVARGRDVALDRRVADRADRLELSFGAAVAPDRRWLGGVGPAFRVEVLPRDVEGPRAWTALSGAVTDGPSLAPDDVHLAGVLAASAGYGPAGARGRLGPELGAGVAFRGAADGLQVAPTLVPSVRAVGLAGPLLGGLDLAAPLFLADGALHASPRLTLTLGVRPGGSR